MLLIPLERASRANVQMPRGQGSRAQATSIDSANDMYEVSGVEVKSPRGEVRQRKAAVSDEASEAPAGRTDDAPLAAVAERLERRRRVLAVLTRLAPAIRYVWRGGALTQAPAHRRCARVACAPADPARALFTRRVCRRECAAAGADGNDVVDGQRRLRGRGL